MIQLTMYTFILIIGMIFFYMIHPLAMGFALLLQTFMICLITGLMNKSFWFSYILFLIFLGGMLVLFIYVTTLASNEMFKLSMKLTIISLTIFMLLTLMYMFMDKNLLMSWSMNNEMNSLTDSFSYFSENSLSLNKLYNYPTNFTTIMLMNYLLITLIVTVKITNMSKGPLRLMT